MRLRSLLSSLALLPSLLCVGQGTKTNPLLINWPLITGAGAPTSACTSLNYGQPYLNTTPTPNAYYVCGADGWQIRGASTSFPSTPGFVYNTSPSASRNGTAGDLNTLLGYVPAQAASLQAGALARYDMLHVVGSSLTDSSGSGNNGTFTATPPTPTTTGLTQSATSGVALPSAVNAAKTFLYTIFVNPTMGQTLAQGGSPWIITSSLGTSGFNMTSSGLNWGVSLYTGTWATSCYALASGYHTYGVTLGAGGGDLDHMYIDGVECGAYQSQGSSAGAQSSGNLYIGSPFGPFAGAGPVGTSYFFEAFPTKFTGAQMGAESTAINNIVTLRGVQIGPLPLNLGLPQITTIGDSITSGSGSTGGNTGWPTRLTLHNQPSYTIVNFGIAGDKLLRMAVDAPYRDQPQCQGTQGPYIAIIDAGTNDITPISGATPAQAFGYLVSYTELLKKAGCRVYWGTMISRAGTGYDANKNAYDALQRMGWKAAGADGIMDFAAIVCLGADGAFGSGCNSGDGIHPNNTGYQAMGDAASRRLDYDFGYSNSNPHILAATGAYAMTAADGTLDIVSASVSSPMTLPSCVGQSYAVYTVSNQQAANTVTVIGNATTEPINGLITAISVPSNTTIAFTDVPNNTTVSGCHWETVR